jgi:probable F420-dependent oxidoreductase
MDIGRIGIWTAQFDHQPWAAVAVAAAELDELGYGALWFHEFHGREPLVQAGLLLGATQRIPIATGIAVIYARDAMAMAASQRMLCEAFPGRFLLGVGISHRPTVEGTRGHVYGPPLAEMRAYLDAMDAAGYEGPRPEQPVGRVLAALRPRMLELARDRADGAHPYFVPVEHTAEAREVLGPGKLLAVEQAVVLEPDPGEARRLGRAHMAWYAAQPNYVENLRRFGFDDADFASGGSDRLVDAIVAWGDEDAVRSRVEAHLQAGADHVCVQPIGRTPGDLGLDQLRRLAPALSL